MIEDMNNENKKDGPADGIATPWCHYHNGPLKDECPLGGKCERKEDWGKATLCRHCELPIRETHMGRVRNEWEHLNGFSFCADSSNYAWPKAAEPASPVVAEAFRSDRELLRDILNFNRSRGDNHAIFDDAIVEACRKVHGFDPRPSHPTPVVGAETFTSVREEFSVYKKECHSRGVGGKYLDDWLTVKLVEARNSLGRNQ